MFSFIKYNSLIVLFILFASLVNAQQTIVSGKIVEAITGTPIPFATVIFTGTTEGTIADFDGNFIVKTTLRVDSLEVRYVGYETIRKSIKYNKAQVINFQMAEDILTLREVIITPRENPAWAIMRNIIKNKKTNDKRRLDAYEYESYTRTELAIDNISKKLSNMKLMKEILTVMDSIQKITGDDNKSVLPIFISEVISKVYFKRRPYSKREHIIKTNIKGTGVEDGSLISQLAGSSRQEYNFYQNWLNILNKEFMSPIANGWKSAYEYELLDSLYIENEYCYKLTFFPKEKRSLAFNGTMWITKEDYAIKRIVATIDDSANINFIENIKIQQELSKTESGAWVPSKNRIVIDIKPLTESTAGFIAKFYTSNKNFIINKPKDEDFFINSISMENDARVSTEEYWSKARHDSLTKTEENVFKMIDTLNNIRAVKVITELAKIIVTNHIKVRAFDIGPYTAFYAKNNIEGHRLGFGARTNSDFSNKWVIGGHIGYGFSDKQLKYNLYTYTILNRNRWTVLKYEQQKEIEQVWLLNEDIDVTSLFYSFSRFGRLRQPFLRNRYRLSFSRQLSAGLNVEVSIKREKISPLFKFNYFSNDARTTTKSSYQTSEARLKIRYGRDETIIVNDNRRINLGPNRFPVYELEYIYGSKIGGADFQYHKLILAIKKRQKIGFLGVSNFLLRGGVLFGDVPYTLAFNAIGNEGIFYSRLAYNQMNSFEFSSDKFIEFRYQHFFEGLLFNKIPLLRRWKWRFLIASNILYGDLSTKNIEISQFEQDSDGNPIYPFRIWENKPYIEVGYGIENILKIFTIRVFHRLTYLDDNINKFGIKGSISLYF